jgi:hypothetical protein
VLLFQQLTFLNNNAKQQFNVQQIPISETAPLKKRTLLKDEQGIPDFLLLIPIVFSSRNGQ